ncbi:MAG: hypothetical protein JWM61_49 [Micrococcaceae bacterium]|jgi:hypothetical protein|uniref:Uncharacterized protein n=1 Tax=Arthrobacter cheniae TaxID=1258888 RepID=A0A3A5MAZ7_9MICC|nr:MULTISPECIES: hypothetical protein [Arthrobacter]MCU1631397.1 hypothetical protein [Micrococcaceae bacterium]MEC5201029.1 hypothetical protein [Arthrobacter sp. PL16]RJT77732.1 hypothetical protein D6T63_14365 [Arthrobacter cheniae]
MNARNTIVLAVDQSDLTEALGCTSEVVESMQDNGVLESQGQLWEIGPARDYLRDAAWADHHWH